MRHREGDWDPQESARSAAARELPAFAEAYFRDGRKAARKGTSAERLHQFRLATKHLRYLLELFDPLYRGKLAGEIERLKAVQTVLGELADCAATRALIRRRDHSETAEVLDHVDRLERRKRKEFRTLWRDLDNEGEEARWLDRLARVPRGSGYSPGSLSLPVECN